MKRTILLATAAIVMVCAAVFAENPVGVFYVLGVWASVAYYTARRYRKNRESAINEIRQVRKEQEEERVSTKKAIQEARLKMSHEIEVREAVEDDLKEAKVLIEKYRADRKKLLHALTQDIRVEDITGTIWKDPEDVFRTSFSE